MLQVRFYSEHFKDLTHYITIPYIKKTLLAMLLYVCENWGIGKLEFVQWLKYELMSFQLGRLGWTLVSDQNFTRGKMPLHQGKKHTHTFSSMGIWKRLSNSLLYVEQTKISQGLVLSSISPALQVPRNLLRESQGHFGVNYIYFVGTIQHTSHFEEC